MSDNRLSIGKVSAKTGCNIETIRFYEKETLLPAPDRTEGGHRLYSTKLVERLVFIRRSRELGFSMAEIRQLLSLVDGEQVSCERVKQIAASLNVEQDPQYSPIKFAGHEAGEFFFLPKSAKRAAMPQPDHRVMLAHRN